MGKTTIMIVFAMTLLLLNNGIYVKADARKPSLKVDRKLKLLNKPAVKSIKSEDGDTIDCVDINKQPAFDHPALRNHIIQMKPTSNFPSETSSTKNESSQLVLSQTWTRSGSCPKGTVPIRRIQRQDLLRADSLKHFGRDGPRTSSATNTTNVQRRMLDVYSPTDHSVAYMFTRSVNFVAAKAEINVWSPSVESAGEYTTSQIWIKSSRGEIFESVEAGWMVNPKLYGNAKPRLFARWTVDGYETTGCIDVTCPGFVQTHDRIALGSIIEPMSQKGGKQKTIIIRLIRDADTGNWWLCLGEMNEKIGYWPKSLFKDSLVNGGNFVQWGGDVYSQNGVLTTPHTTTGMGSGELASGLWGNAANIREMKIVTAKFSEFKLPRWIQTYSDEPDCYSVSIQDLVQVPPAFYFGGPGRNAKCA